MGLQERFTNERAWHGSPGIPDGADIERAVFGSIIEKAPDEYAPYTEALAYVKENQPSVFGRSEIVKTLRARVAQLGTDRDNPVRFFTAVGTPLDTYHGVDAFFEQGIKRVTLDISLREKEAYKADILMHATLTDDGEVVVAPNELERVAAAVAQRLSAH